LKSTQADAATLIPKIIKSLKADLVQTIGHRVVIYRPHPTEPRIVLPT
jgi:RNA-binding protein YhbY